MKVAMRTWRMKIPRMEVAQTEKSEVGHARMKRIRTARRLLVSFATAGALMLGMLSFAASAGAATSAQGALSTRTSLVCPSTEHLVANGKCVKIVETRQLGPQASAALKKALSTPAGRAALENAFRTLKGAKVGLLKPTGRFIPQYNCPGGTSCGVSSAGGWHFWFIASYAAVFNVGAFPFWVACTGALSPIIDPVLATAACGAVTGIIWALVNNAPYTTRHGIWMAVYWNHISDGYW